MDTLSQTERAPRDPNLLPKHVGIIMDGNGRWAQQRGLPRSAGHKEGAEVMRTIAKYASRIGIQNLTVYAFSTENWKRSKLEVKALMALFKRYLRIALEDFERENISMGFLGDTTVFSDDLQELMDEIREKAKLRDGMKLNIAMNYGGRAELVRAFRKLAVKTSDGSLTPDQINEQLISDALDTAGQPDPDLIIRPSGEFRTSNFLLWQSAYAEYVFMDEVLWPDFTPAHFEQALDLYASRDRRFGGVKSK